MARMLGRSWRWTRDTRWHKRHEQREVSAELAGEIREALEATDRGETVDLGTFAQYADDDLPLPSGPDCPVPGSVIR
jgi:hypothetical protein